MIKGSIHEEDIIILNVYAPHNVASKYMKQNPKESQGEIRQIRSMARILILICWKFSRINRTSISRAMWKCWRSDTKLFTQHRTATLVKHVWNIY